MGYSTSSSSLLYLVFFTCDHYIEPTELKIQEMVNTLISGEAYYDVFNQLIYMHHSRGSFYGLHSLFVDNKKGKRYWSGMAWIKGKTKIVSFMARFNYLNFSTSYREVRTRFVVVLSSSNRRRLLGLLDLMIQNKKE